jgi:hypothetical protein
MMKFSSKAKREREREREVAKGSRGEGRVLLSVESH